MPRGVPKAGYRRRFNNVTGKFGLPSHLRDQEDSGIAVDHAYESNNVHIKESDEEIRTRISDRFKILKTMTESCIFGDSRSLIVSGPAGLGKSYTVEKALAEWNPDADSYTTIKGFVRATGLFKTLYKYRQPGQVVVFDDADSIFYDDVSLNILKAVCDTTEIRKVSWLSEGVLIDEEEAETLPKTFQFDGTIIFITNLDFDTMIERGHKLAKHLEALMSRSYYIDLAMKNKRDFLIRIRQVVKEGMLSDLTVTEKEDVLSFVERHSNVLREISLRMVIKIAAIRRTNMEWEKVAKVTCCKNQ